jgi:heat shock protein HtpX
LNKNVMKTFVYLAALSGLFIFIGNMLGGSQGMTIALGIAAVMNLGSIWASDKIVIKMTRSRPVTEQEAPWLYRIVRQLTQRAGMPMPKLYVMPAAQPNAFATGRNPEHAAVAVTEGILNVLDEQELEGVIAHELAHVKNRDILIGAVAATIGAAISYLGYMLLFFGGSDDEDSGPLGAFGMLLFFILSPIAAALIQAAVSRSREAQADRSGAELLGDPTPLARALIKIDAAAKQTPPMQVNPAISHVFLQNPLRGASVAKLFMTHPPLEERIEQLRELGAKV